MNVQELHKQLTKLIEDGHGDAVVTYYDGHYDNFEVGYTALNINGVFFPDGYSGSESGKILEFY